MVKQYRIKSTSNHSAHGEDIILRQTKTTRLLFRPQLVDNVNDSNASVRGTFIFQKKNMKNKWEDYKELDNNRLKADEWIKLDIKSSELLKLMTELNAYYEIHKEYGINPGFNKYNLIEKELHNILELVNDDQELLEILSNRSNGEFIIDTVKWIANKDEPSKIIDQLKNAEDKELERLNTYISITNIKKLLDKWDSNRNEKNEEYWQKLFKENSWIISQIFATPLVFFQDKAYLGGKGLSNKGGKEVDFIYQNGFTKDVSLIEIKTPNTSLLSKEYRNNVFSIHNDLSGAIVQVLSYKEKIQRDYNAINADTISDFSVFNPICVVIAGNIKELEGSEIQSFELYRKELKNVIVITFDELYEKIKHLLDLISDE
ncbi:DUF4263 domain-containing protein [Pontibacillus yanchengensis]|uniref:DUF4263 domain-containing protein n=1 Tax=Pontibacillus yanchengensis TaxID=462910 RepID=A0A6I5A3E2_9BACI|nr:Shedu immune nuclease family protein [Pontibacillus yanchengensis]MYL33249.1 DUF4263 domain-containing protein [Pontibacillus yanchengensis]